MSKYDKCAYRYPDDCPFDGCKVPREKHVPGMSHAFVEPVSAPQPPADDPYPECYRLGCAHDPCSSIDGSPVDATTEFWCCCECKKAGHMRKPKPAAPHVTGDGNDAVDIAKRHWDKLTKAGGDQLDYTALDDACIEAYAAGIARGRALGAREAIAVAREFSDRRDVSASKITNQYERSVQRDLASEAKAVADEIARRAGREGK